MASSEIKTVMDMCVRGAGSPARLIQNSPELQRRFAAMCKAHAPDVCGDGEARNLRAAKHRFESYAAPMGRMVRLWPAYIRTAMACAIERQNDKAKRGCSVFLSWINPIDALTLGMLADASDESLCLTRFCDSKTMDPAELNSEIHHFIDRVEALFGEQECCFKVTSYTKMMVAHLSSPLLWILRGRHYSLGRDAGPTREEQRTCLARMRCWLHLCKAELAAEFPDFAISKARLSCGWHLSLSRIFCLQLCKFWCACCVDCLAWQFGGHFASATILNNS